MPRLFTNTASSNSLFAIPKTLKFPVLFGVFIASLTMLITLLVYTSLPLEIPLFYSLPEEAEHIVPRQYIFIVPVFMLVALTIHTFVTKFMYTFDVTSATIFVWLTNAFMILGLFIIARLIYII